MISLNDSVEHLEHLKQKAFEGHGAPTTRFDLILAHSFSFFSFVLLLSPSFSFFLLLSPSSLLVFAGKRAADQHGQRHQPGRVCARCRLCVAPLMYAITAGVQDGGHPGLLGRRTAQHPAVFPGQRCRNRHLRPSKKLAHPERLLQPHARCPGIFTLGS